MIVGIDFRAMAKGMRSGVEEYVYQISRALAKSFPNHEFRLFYNARRRAPLDFDWLRWPNVKLVESGLPNRLIDVTGMIFSWPKADRMLGGVDVFFSPHFFWVSLERAPRVITFHDLSFLRYPEFFPWQKKIWHKRMLLRKQIADAKRLIAVSESTKRDLIEYYGVPENKIAVVYEGVDKSEFAPMRRDHLWIIEFRKRNKLPERFLLFLATIEPRKNVDGIIRAFELAHSAYMVPRDLHLVIAGNRGWLSGNLFQMAHSKCLAGMVHFRSVKPDERKFWYNAAEALIFPSFFEGFGLPPLEAMACGTPVITSNRSSIPEVVGSSSIMVDPFKPEELAFAISSISKDARLRALLAKRAVDAVERFSWQAAAKNTFAILEDVR